MDLARSIRRRAFSSKGQAQTDLLFEFGGLVETARKAVDEEALDAPLHRRVHLHLDEIASKLCGDDDGLSDAGVDEFCVDR